MKKYYNDAFIGNENITASFSKYGELLRLYYPLPDYRQYSDFFHVGVKINDSNLVYLHNDINNRYNQYYTPDTNILNTEIDNGYFNLHVLQTDCVMINKDVIIKKYVFKNNNSIDLKIDFVAYSKVVSSFNNMAGGLVVNDALIQYSHNFTCAIFSNQKILAHQLNECDRNISSGTLYDKDYIGMSPESAVSYDIGTLKPGESKEFTLIMYMKYEETNINNVEEEVKNLKRININREIARIKEHDKKLVQKHDTLHLKSDGSKYMDRLVSIYHRTILYMPLLMNAKTGAVTASLEVDEERDKCGRYAYCWPRDAVMIYSGLNNLDFLSYSKKLYQIFLKNTQSKNGMWEQRFYSDGRLAPCWGYQIDETAIVVWGLLQHYKKEQSVTGKKNITFLRSNLRMLEKACDFLEKYINFIVGIEEKEDLVRIELEKDYNYKERDEIYKHPSYDLWEMNEGVHLYSLSAIYGAFKSMIDIYNELSDTFSKNRLKQDDVILRKARYESLMREIKNYIMNNLYDKEKKVLVRNTNDRLTDISIMGAIVPFEVFEPNEKLVRNTVEQINMTLRTYLGGYLRFQNDTYIGGNIPWIISTAWMGLYYKKIGDNKAADECMKFIVNSANDLGLLAEQANIEKNERWVIGLGWSHAMFINLLVENKEHFHIK
ncbi:MAG: hypothetical protein IKG56_03285 [Clostridia bacterium]|nr:hypothetical protein [Clostridia bacterium]